MSSLIYIITGHDAIRLSDRESLQIRCYAHPLDEGGQIHLGLARQIVREDPGLVYVEVVPSGWRDRRGNYVDAAGRNVCDYFRGETYFGPDDDGIEPGFNDATSSLP